eukprot:g14653.t1
MASLQEEDAVEYGEGGLCFDEEQEEDAVFPPMTTKNTKKQLLERIGVLQAKNEKLEQTCCDFETECEGVAKKCEDVTKKLDDKIRERDQLKAENARLMQMQNHNTPSDSVMRTNQMLQNRLRHVERLACAGLVPLLNNLQNLAARAHPLLQNNYLQNLAAQIQQIASALVLHSDFKRDNTDAGITYPFFVENQDCRGGRDEGGGRGTTTSTSGGPLRPKSNHHFYLDNRPEDTALWGDCVRSEFLKEACYTGSASFARGGGGASGAVLLAGVGGQTNQPQLCNAPASTYFPAGSPRARHQLQICDKSPRVDPQVAARSPALAMIGTTLPSSGAAGPREGRGGASGDGRMEDRENSAIKNNAVVKITTHTSGGLKMITKGKGGSGKDGGKMKAAPSKSAKQAGKGGQGNLVVDGARATAYNLMTKGSKMRQRGQGGGGQRTFDPRHQDQDFPMQDSTNFDDKHPQQGRKKTLAQVNAKLNNSSSTACAGAKPAKRRNASNSNVNEYDSSCNDNLKNFDHNEDKPAKKARTEILAESESDVAESKEVLEIIDDVLQDLTSEDVDCEEDPFIGADGAGLPLAGQRKSSSSSQRVAHFGGAGALPRSKARRGRGAAEGLQLQRDNRNTAEPPDIDEQEFQDCYEEEEDVQRIVQREEEEGQAQAEVEDDDGVECYAREPDVEADADANGNVGGNAAAG